MAACIFADMYVAKPSFIQRSSNHRMPKPPQVCHRSCRPVDVRSDGCTPEGPVTSSFGTPSPRLKSFGTRADRLRWHPALDCEALLPGRRLGGRQRVGEREQIGLARRGVGARAVRSTGKLMTVPIRIPPTSRPDPHPAP